MSGDEWKERLQPFAKPYAAFMNDLQARLRQMSDDELQQLDLDIKQPNQRNCWWATYDVAQLMQDEILIEFSERRRNRGEAT